MKILLITFDFPPIVSGITTYVGNIWRFLPANDHTILAPYIRGCRKIDADAGWKVIRYPNLPSAIMRSVFLLPVSVFIAIRRKIDLVICSVPVSLGFIGMILKKIFKIPYGVIYYGGEFAKYRHNGFLLRLLRYNLRHADCVITISDFSREEIKGYGVSAEKILKITPGVDTDRFNPRIDASNIRKKFGLQDKNVILTVSRLIERKGIDSVIRAMRLIREEIPDAVYLVVGTGEAEGYLKGLAAAEGLNEAVLFAGFVPDEGLPRYYNACDLFVMANKETRGDETLEGFGISFIEASACGKAVVGGVSGGVKDAVADGLTGVLVDPEDSMGLAQTICRILKDEKYRNELGRAGRRRVEESFGWQSRGECLEHVFQEMVNKNHA